VIRYRLDTLFSSLASDCGACGLLQHNIPGGIQVDVVCVGPFEKRLSRAGTRTFYALVDN